MYSPEIREDLVMRVYEAAKEASVTMTNWVNRAVEQSLASNKRRKERMEREILDRKKSNKKGGENNGRKR